MDVAKRLAQLAEHGDTLAAEAACEIALLRAALREALDDVNDEDVHRRLSEILPPMSISVRVISV